MGETLENPLETNGQPWETHMEKTMETMGNTKRTPWKTMGNPLEKHKKTIGQPWDSHGKT